MSPNRNHVEARARREPVRQYVSETHDHKPDAPRRRPVIELHKGIDYAVLMLPHQTTDAPLAHLYGSDREVTRYGKLFAAAPLMLGALERIADLLQSDLETHFGTAVGKQIRTAIAAGKGGAS